MLRHKLIYLITISGCVLLPMTPTNAAGLKTFARPQSKAITTSPKTTKITTRFRAIPDAIIWHAPPSNSHIINPSLLDSNSLDLLALEYLLEGCRRHNPEFAELEKQASRSQSRLSKFGKLILSNSPLHINIHDNSHTNYLRIVDHIKSEYNSFKTLYSPHCDRQSQTLKISQQAQSKLEELCGTEAMRQVINLFTNT